MTEPQSYDIAAQTVVAMRMLELDTARLATTDGDDAHGKVFRQWLHGLPLPPDGSAARPLRALGMSVTASFDRVTWRASGATSAMIGPAAAFFQACDASDAELATLTRLGGLIEPDIFGSWLETVGESFNVGWDMSRLGDRDGALRAFADGHQRSTLERFLGNHDDARIASIARSVGAGAVTTRALMEIGSSADDDSVAAATQLLDDLDAPTIDDEVLGALLSDAGEGALALSIWSLDDGFARVGFAVAEPPLSLVIRLAAEGGWVDSLDRIAAVQAALDAEHPVRVECFVAAAGPGVELTYELAVS